MPEQVIDQQNQDGQQQNQDGQQQQQQIDWETDDNPYKQRYLNSERQAPALVNVLKQNGFEYDHNTKSWKKAQAPQQGVQTDDDVERLLEGYDPDFRKSLKVYTEKQIEKAIRTYNEQSTSVTSYNTGLTAARKRVAEEFGNEYELIKDGNFNANSPLYKVANDILMRDYSEFNPDGSLKKYSRADAEYKAVAEAWAILQRQSKKDPNFGKGKLGAIQGKGGLGGSAKGKLSQEEYFKLTDDQKDAYDAQNMGD